ncbi:MAG: quinolinate synthase NadA [Candidatus Dadabacteria bacterium]|nr:quinolinate synthase NadA [Candidatus Dadabacteria bacterium]
MEEKAGIIAEINRLRKEKNAVILAHNYQIPDVQDIADFVGDSLGLSQEAEKTGADIIVFCGVHFMAETASIISPNKKVLIPDLGAGCSLSDTITADQLRDWKKQHPGAVVVSYVNTTAEVKSESDYCCTSTNAVDVVNSIPEDKEILFLPDMFLGAFVARETGRNIDIWPGECHVHADIKGEDIKNATDKHPDAELVIHPECGCSTSTMYECSNGTFNGKPVKVLSTGGMLKHAESSKSNEFIIATETGILHTLKKHNPDKEFYAANDDAVCKFMKMINLSNVLQSLQQEQFEVKVPELIAGKAKNAIDRMLEISAQVQSVTLS